MTGNMLVVSHFTHPRSSLAAAHGSEGRIQKILSHKALLVFLGKEAVNDD